MPADNTGPSSLSEMFQAAQASAVAAPDAAVVATPPETQAVDNSAAAETQVTDDTTNAVVDTTTDAIADPATDIAADSAAAAAAATTFDWGTAMPALANKARELLGEEAGVFTKYGDIDGLIRSIAERERQVGEQSKYVGAFKNLDAAGVTIDDLRALMAYKAGQGQPPAFVQPANGNSNGQANGVPAWSKKFLASTDAEGKPIWNRSELARAGITEQQAAQSRAAFQESLADRFGDEDSFREYIANFVDPRMGQVAQQTKQQLAQAQLAQRAQDAEIAAANGWATNAENAKLVYVNGRDEKGGITKFGRDMETYMQQLNPSMSHLQKLESAKHYVLAVNRPAAAATPATNGKATRQPATAAQGKKLDMDSFFKQYKERIPRDGELSAWIAYQGEGKIPAAQT